MASQTKTLTTELIMFKTKTNQLDRIRNLNLCANDLANIGIVSQMTSLEVLSLSVNSISTLKEIGSCFQLKELYIRRNCVESLDEIEHLVPLKNLKIIWLAENPIATIPGYRQHVIRKLPQLEKLDNVEVSFEEKQAAQQNPTAGQHEQQKQQQQSSMAELSSQPNNSFAAAAKHRMAGGNDASPQTSPIQPNARDNPNSTNPYFLNKVRSPDNLPKQRLGFGSNNEINRSPTLDETPPSTTSSQQNLQQQQQTEITDEKPAQNKINVNKQVRAGMAGRRGNHEKPEKYDLGNNFIRKGSGLARTPPRPNEESKSYSNSPNERPEQQQPNIEILRPFLDQKQPQSHPEVIDTEPSPISWPSRNDQQRQSPMGGPKSIQQPQQQQPQSASNRNTGLALAAQQQQVQMQGKQSSPTLIAPRQVKSPTAQRKAMTGQSIISGSSTPQQNMLNQQHQVMPSIAIPPNLNDPNQLQQLLQLNQLLMQQQQLGQASPAGFSGLVQQQHQQMAAAQQHQDAIGKQKQRGQAQQQQQTVAAMKKPRGQAPTSAAASADHPYRRDENILCAILALLKELDKNGLEFVIKDCNKRITKMENFQ